jgi:ubiquinone/menaquinone biosynthesis C-methylase UbiE
MATPWDRAAEGYVKEWVPRFVPYHLDLIRETTLRPGNRVLVVSAGPGSEVLAAARAVGDHGYIRATDKSGEMVRILSEQVKQAGFRTRIDCETSDAMDASHGPFDAVICAFGMWQLEARVAALRAWREALQPAGKVAIITWGPPEADQPFEVLHRCLLEVEPSYALPASNIHAAREAMEKMFGDAGLAMVRHTVVRHTLSFPTAEAFVRAMGEACTWRRVWEELGEARLERVAAKFYEKVGGPDEPVTFQPPATLAIATHPDAEIELEVRPSVRAPSRPPPT